MKNANEWTRIQQKIARVPLRQGYRFALLQRHDIPEVVACLQAWFPEINVGSASCYLREDFFYDDVHLTGAPGGRYRRKMS